MVDPRHRKAPTLDAPAEFTGTPPWRRAAIAVAAVVVIAAVWFIYSQVSEGNATERWGSLAAIEGVRDESGDSTRAWLDVPAPAGTVHARDEEITKLEAFLAKQGSNPELAAHVHALLANLELTQALGISPTAHFEAMKSRYDAADAHLEKIETAFPDAPMNWDRFRPNWDRNKRMEEASITKLLRRTLKANRAWDEAHGMKDAAPDADVVVLLRTTRGDLRLRPFTAQSPTLSKAFLDRVCAGAYTGTSFFAKREETDETWVHAGDARTRKTDKESTDTDRLTWGDASPGEALLADEGRNLILHTKGILSAWHRDGDEEDDPVQFLIVAKDSPRLNYEFTPFARVDDASLATLDHILASPSRRQQKREILADANLSKLADQFANPITIVKALVYEKGTLKACGDGLQADESEKRLDTVKPDASLVPEPPAKPPTPPAETPTATVPAMDEPGKTPPASPAGPANPPATPEMGK